MPPQMRSAAAPSDSPMAKPIKHAPALSLDTNSKIAIIIISSTQMSSTPMDMPDLSGRLITLYALPSSEEKAVRAFA